MTENNYWHDGPQDNYAGKCIVANYIVLSVTLYFAGKGMPKSLTVNMKQATEEKPYQVTLNSTLI